MMVGYWNRPDASAESIVDGWLRTGDAGRMDEEGYLYIEDRVKDMVVTGAEIVYPAEVERVLIQHPAVAEVAVTGMPDEKRGETVHAIVTPESGSAPEAAELIAYARERLAHYKCPTGITFVDALSRNCSSATSGRSSPDHLCGQALLNSAEETTRRHPADRRRT